MGEALRRRVMAWLRVGLEPHLPPGSEGSCEVFRAGWPFLRYRQVLWAFRQLASLAGLLVAYFFLREFLVGPLPAEAARIAMVLEALAVLAFLVQLPFSWLAIRWDYDCRWYLLSDRCLRIQEGMLNLKEQTFTLANIQDIQVKQNPLQRSLGLWDLEVRTAGGGEQGPGEPGSAHAPSLHTARLRGIADGPAVRDRLLSRMAEARDAGLGEGPRPAVGPEPAGDLAVRARKVRDAAAALRESLRG